MVIDSPDDADTFKEVHIVTFPDAQAFAAYRADDALKPMAHVRARAVMSTEVLVGEEGEGYLGFTNS